jgi:fatty acid/phospholipid biosynthesis enzyme
MNKAITGNRLMMDVTGLFDIGVEVSNKNEFIKDFEKFLIEHDAMFLGYVERKSLEIGVDCEAIDKFL